MSIINFLKKCFILIIAVLSVSIFTSANIQAQSGDTTEILLQQILTVLQNMDKNITTLITNFSTYVVQWTTADTSEQPMTSVSAYSQTLGNNISVQNGLDKDGKGATIQTQLLNNLFYGADSKSLLNINELTYTSLLKLPYKIETPEKNSDPAFGFIKNAAGLNISHIPPWSYKFLDKTRNTTDPMVYADYYNTMMSIESFNAYILSGFYVDYLMNATPLTQQQLALVNQANDKNWFTQMSSQYIGYVLRQILLYESQAFVVLTELLQTNKQLLAAQVMNNTLLILNNQANEKKLFQKAAGIPVTP